MMDHQYIEENNLVERYVLGRLPVEEQVCFEEHFAECDECVEQLELADDLGAALSTAVAEDVRLAVGTGFGAALARRFSGWAGRGTMLALGLALLAVLPALWMASENRQLAGDLERLRQPLANLPALLLTLKRDTAADPAPVLTLEPGQDWLSLAVEVTPDPGFESFHARVRGGAGVVWEHDGLQPNLWNVLQLTFPAELLPAGLYHLEIETDNASGRGGPVDDFPFRIAVPKGQ